MVDGKWGYIDTRGEFVIPPQFARADVFSEGLASVSFSSGDRVWEAQFGYIDKTGALVIPARFNWVGSFSEGLAPVCEGVCSGTIGFRDRKIGYIDRSGDYVIQPTFAYAESFSEGLASVSFDRVGEHRYGYIDRTGAFVIQPKWWATGPFRQGLAATYSGYIDRQGQLVVPVPEQPGGHVMDFSDGLGLVLVADDSVYYDAKGRICP